MLLWLQLPAEGVTSSVPIGRPIANTQIYILDGHGEPVPVGVAGELYIGGAGVARGYLNRPELTAERFLADPFSERAQERMYRTGDLGRWLEDGTIEFLGRNDFQVKIRGYRIELGEIEARLMEHAEVREAVVIAREDTPGEKRLVAYYTCGERSEATQEGPGAEALRTLLAAKLPEYMVPAAYVRLAVLPLTLNGKLDRRALPAPEGDAYAVRGYEAPVGEIEQALADIWAAVLKIDRVGRHDHFFELGGHSLLTLRVVNLLAQVGITILAVDMFTYPNIESLAANIELQGRRSLTNGAICIRRGGPQPPLFLAHCGEGELLYLPALTPHIDTDIPIYGLPARSADEATLRTVEGMAIRMVQMIRAVQPVGPYRVAGWSGGTLAYEVAAQLIGADQKVEFLGLFDTHYAAGMSDSSERPLDNFNDKDRFLSLIEAVIQTEERPDEERRASDS